MKTTDELKALHGEDYVALFTREQTLERLRRVIEWAPLPAGAVVADFACGSGMLMELLWDRVASYVGVDFSEAFIKVAEEKRRSLAAANVRFACQDIREFCAGNPERFDVAFAMDFSEHVYDAEWLEILRSIRSSLKPGGILYLHTPNGDFFIERMKARNFLIKQFPQHVAVRNTEDNVRLLEQAGFSQVNVRHLAHYNILRLLHGLSFLPGVGRYFEARLLMTAVR